MTTPLVRAADIAAMANVSRAAVTQWRRRHDDFPSPKEDADSDSPLFDRVEVERWLAARVRRQTTRTSDDTAEIAYRLADHLRGIVEPHQALEITSAGLVFEYLTRALAERQELEGTAAALRKKESSLSGRQPRTVGDLSDTEMAEWLRHISSGSAELSSVFDPLDLGRPEIVTYLHALAAGTAALPLRKFLSLNDALLLRARDRANIDPEPLSKLLTGLANLEHGTVLDPAVGAGSTLLTFGRNRALSLVGVDVRGTALATARRRAILANREVDLRFGNSLGTDPATGVLADAVVVNPPWGLRDFGSEVDLHDPRWIFGRPPLRSETIWLQQAIEHLTKQGRAFIVTPRGGLFQSGQVESIRRELLRRGTVEAIIGLPPGLFEPLTRIPTALWILAHSGQVVDPDRVLLLDIPTLPGQNGSSAFDDAVREYRSWRTEQQVRDTKHAILVPVRELLEPGANLTPETWLARRDAPSAENLIQQVRDVHRTLAKPPTQRIEPLPEFIPANAVRREKLTALPGVTIHRGIQSRPDKTTPGTGVPVLTGRALNKYAQYGELDEPDHFVDPSALREGSTTRPGDIIFFGIGQIPAHRFDVEGWAVSAHGSLIRIAPDASLDPDYVVACINAHVRSLLPAGTPVRILPPRIDIPIIPLADQRQIGRTIRNLTSTTKEAEQHLARLRQLTGLLENAAGAGALGLPAEPSHQHQ